MLFRRKLACSVSHLSIVIINLFTVKMFLGLTIKLRYRVILICNDSLNLFSFFRIDAFYTVPVYGVVICFFVFVNFHIPAEYQAWLARYLRDVV
jgi:hypothetical protein